MTKLICVHEIEDERDQEYPGQRIETYINPDHIYMVSPASTGAFIFMTNYTIEDGGLHVEETIEEIIALGDRNDPGKVAIDPGVVRRISRMQGIRLARIGFTADERAEREGKANP